MMANRLGQDEDTLVENVNFQIRCSDEDLVSEFHQDQQAYPLHQQAGYKTTALPKSHHAEITCSSGSVHISVALTYSHVWFQ
jgi:hypothetical protein